MDRLVDLFGFLSVVFRGLALTAQAVTVGGVVFLLGVLGAPSVSSDAAALDMRRRSAVLIRIAALALAVVAAASIAMDGAVLIETMELPWPLALSAPFAIAGSATCVGALLVAALIHPAPGRGRSALLAAAVIVLLAASVATSHAVARVDDRLLLVAASAAHQAGADVWIGGIPFFLIALAGVRAPLPRACMAKRFSRLCAVAVAAIAASAAVNTVAYIGSVDAVYGTAYGLMSATKAVMFAGLLLFGAANFLAVRRLGGQPELQWRLRRFAEVELGVGITVFFAAASLTSLPPAVDLTQDRVSWGEIVEHVLEPRLPVLTSPDHASLAIPAEQARLDREAAAAREQAPQAFVPGTGELPPRGAEDIAWSEYNHHWAGIFVLLIGLLATLNRAGWKVGARHWPLLFIALAVFLLIRSDPETWPLGSIGFFESLRDPEVLQHRILVLLVGTFGIFEWRVRVGGLGRTRAAYVFPVSNALGGGMLLTHSHALANIQQQLLVEMSHIPMALLGITAGWARWLELRSGPPAGKIASWVWPVCFIGIGVVLLAYRES